MKLGERFEDWSSNDQEYIDIHGKTGRRILIEWSIPTEEYEQDTRNLFR